MESVQYVIAITGLEVISSRKRGLNHGAKEVNVRRIIELLRVFTREME
jgi:hypothetical protein